jgi:hypothetical protein
MDLEMLHGVGSDVKESKKSRSSKRVQLDTSENSDVSKEVEALVPLQISINESSEDKAEATAAPPTSSPPQSVRFAVEDDVIIRETKEDTYEEETKSVTFSDRDAISGDDKSVSFSDKDAEILLNREAVSADDKSVSFSDKGSVTFSDRDDVISGDDKSVTFSDKDAEIIPDTYDEDSESIDVTEEESAIFSEAEARKEVSVEEVEEQKVNVENETEDAQKKEKTADIREAEMRKADEKFKVFAYGDLYDDMTEALDRNKVLFGIITTSVEEILEDEAYLRIESKEHHSEITPISIQYSGPNAHYSEVKNYQNQLHEIGSLCKKLCQVDRLNPIVYGNKIETRNRILTLLGEDHQDEVYPEVLMPESSGTRLAQQAANHRSMIAVDTGDLTAYKHALNIQGVTGVPKGPELLKIVREPLGAPYNWVLFKASQTELIVEDGGSGGVMELAKVVHRDYNDKVLFGLARVSFAGDFGLRQFWCALEWKGENASGVKALMSYREALAPMAELIGDRSFTLSNTSAMDLSPQIVVDFVKKSCNVAFLDVNVDALKSAHETEQKAIEEYWTKLEAKEKAKIDARTAERMKIEDEERGARLKIRTSKLAKTAALRAARKEKWSKMNAPELLEDLGRVDLTGWVLLEVNLEK